MVGVVFSVAIGFRNYGGDGVTEWLAVVIAIGALIVMIASLYVMFRYTRLIYWNFKRDTLNFEQDTKARRNLIAKQTTDQVRKLESLFEDASYLEIRNKTTEIRRIKRYFESMSNDEKDDEERIEKHFNDWKDLYHGVLNVLIELSITHHLIKEGAISMHLLNSCSGGRILLEHKVLLKPLLSVWELIDKLSPEKRIYYRYTWDGITELVMDLRELRLKAL